MSFVDDTFDRAAAAKASTDIVSATAQSGSINNSHLVEAALKQLADDPNCLDEVRRIVGDGMSAMGRLHSATVVGLSTNVANHNNSAAAAEGVKQLTESAFVTHMPPDADAATVTKLGEQHLARNIQWRQLVAHTALLVGLLMTAIMIAAAYKLLARTKQLCEKGAADRLLWKGNIDAAALAILHVRVWLASIASRPLTDATRMQVLQQQAQVESLRNELTQIQLELNSHTAAVDSSSRTHSSGFWTAIGVIGTTALSVAVAPLTAVVVAGSVAAVVGAGVVAAINAAGGERAASEKEACTQLDQHLQSVRQQGDTAASEAIRRLNQ